MLNQNRMAEARTLAERNYDIHISCGELSDGTIMFLAKSPELVGCKAQGRTIEEAIASLVDARTDYIYFLIEDNRPIPSPNMNA